MKLIYTITAMLLLLQAGATVRRVRTGATGNGTGTTWANAYTSLENALNASVAGDQVWVSKGTYKPNNSGTFTVKPGVKLYGGFSDAGEPTFTERAWTTNKTYLQKADAYNYSIVQINSTNDDNTLEGFYIQNGNAVDGAGVYIYGNGSATGPSIQNVLFDNCVATGYGGGMRANDAIVKLFNVFFQLCRAQYGGSMYTDAATPIVRQTVFERSVATSDGGAVYVYDRGPNNQVASFTNCIFYGDYANSVSGGVYVNSAPARFINSTFTNNGCTLSNNAGAAINMYTPSGTDSARAKGYITNCIFYNNKTGTTGSIQNADIGKLRGYLYPSYSFYKETATFTGTGNVASGSINPFFNASNPMGPDNTWFTTDDGYQLSICNSSAVIDKGKNDSISETNDVVGLTRKRATPLISNSTTAAVDMGAYENQDATTAAQVAGFIKGAHVIPYPQELTPDYVADSVSAASGTTIRWEQQVSSNINWVDATPASTSLSYPIPQLTQTTNYRRVATSATYCSTPYYSNTVQIKVANPNPTQAGAIKGKVTSPNGTGVQGIQIKITRQVAISGSPAGYTYIDTTDGAGEFSVSPVYYGDLDSSNASANFTITPIKASHNFNPTSALKTVSYYDPKPTAVSFTDNTVLSITGRTYQECEGCITTTGNMGLVSCNVDSISIYKDGGYFTLSQYINGSFGQYGVTVSDPVPVKIEPRFMGHSFDTAFKIITPVNDVSGVDFKDITTHTISGKLTAGCGELIGIAVLEFSDVLPPDANGHIRPQGCFKKQTSVLADGSFSIVLPARPYKVRVFSFSPSSGSNIQATTLIDFFDNRISKDSLYRNITTHDTTLNLVYERPPVIAIVEGLALENCTSLGRFSIIKQAETENFRVKVFQGQPTNNAGCAVIDSINKVVLYSNVPSQTMSPDSSKFSPIAAGVVVGLKGGAPNVAGNHFKSLALYYTDKYGRTTSLVRDSLLVTGALQDAGANFFTVKPGPLPLMVLHDPPGSNSYSYWQSVKNAQTAFKMYASSSRDEGGWLEVKLGTKLETGIFVSTETEIWATANGSITKSKTNTSATEQIFSTQLTTDVSTSDAESETGSDGDVYVVAAMNMTYTSATEISYNNCQIKDTTTMLFAPGIPTLTYPSEKHIKSVTIPGLYNLAELQPNQYKKDSVKNEAKLWEQMIANNTRNKQNAASTNQNITFVGGGSGVGSSITTTRSKVSTVEFSMSVDTSLAAAAGFEIAGNGVSGGGIVNFKTEIGGSTELDSTEESTVGYSLRDANGGDQFSVNIKTDQQSGTPVFELLAGQSSCPPEEGTQLRDQLQLSTPTTIATDTNQVGTLEYKLYLSNISAITTDASRDFNVYLDAASNSDGAEVSINAVTNTNAGNPVVIPVVRRQQQQITVRVKKVTTSPVYSYTGLAIIATDACGDVTDTVRLSAYFTSPCSSVKMEEPGDNWIQAGSNYQKQVLVKWYDRNNLISINLQYAAAGSSNWNDVLPILTRDSLNTNPILGTFFNWNTSGMADGAYNIRLKLLCSQGVVYSEKAGGIIDHTAPALLGKPSPTDDNYVNGDVISFSYNEDIAINNISTNNVAMARLANGVATPVDVTVTGYRNSIVIVPAASINNLVGSTIRVIVKDVYDVYGNKKMAPDTSYFLVGTTIVATGTNAMKVAIAKPRVSKSTDSTIDISFKLPVAVTADSGMRVNYIIGGTARLGKDYNIEYIGYQPSYAYFNAAQGSIRLPKSSNQVMFKIHPLSDTALTPEKTVTISLSEGGDYALGDTTTRTGVITSEDGISTYTFIGNGNFSDKTNWLNGKAPLTTLVSGKTIIINPSGTCMLDVPLTIKPGATLRVVQYRSFIIPGNLKLN